MAGPPCAGVTGGCDPHDVGAGIRLRQSSKQPEAQAISPAPPLWVFKTGSRTAQAGFELMV